MKHGHYSKIIRPNLRGLMDEIAATETDLLNLEGETLLLKALVTDYVNRFDQITEAIIAWHGSYNGAMQTLLTTNSAAEIKTALVALREGMQSRPVQLLDISSVSVLIERIGRTVERIYKMRSEHSISMETLRRLMEQMALIVVRHCDAELAGRIEKDWGAIVVVEDK